jgi:hypothetical protein
LRTNPFVATVVREVAATFASPTFFVAMAWHSDTGLIAVAMELDGWR